MIKNMTVAAYTEISVRIAGPGKGSICTEISLQISGYQIILITKCYINLKISVTFLRYNSKYDLNLF